MKLENLNYLRQQIDELRKELQQKMNVDDAMGILDSKASKFFRIYEEYYNLFCKDIEELNKIIKNMQADIEERATQEELRNIVADQALINESLCTENILGRWAWRSGKRDCQIRVTCALC